MDWRGFFLINRWIGEGERRRGEELEEGMAVVTGGCTRNPQDMSISWGRRDGISPCLLQYILLLDSVCLPSVVVPQSSFRSRKHETSQPNNYFVCQLHTELLQNSSRVSKDVECVVAPHIEYSSFFFTKNFPNSHFY